MKVNFEIEENYAVVLNKRHIDLHNNFKFLDFNKSSNGYYLNFIKSEGDWVNQNEFKKLTFNFINVKNHYIQESMNNDFPEDENILSTITFFPQDQKTNHFYYIAQSLPKENDDIIFVFENEKVFRFSCDKVELKTFE